MTEELDNFEPRQKPKRNLIFKAAIVIFFVSILFRFQHYPGAFYMSLISSGLLFRFALFSIFKLKIYNATMVIATMISVLKLGEYANYLFSGWRFPEISFAFFISIAFGTFVWLKS